MEADRIEAALAGLDPEARALVELSLIRDVADEDIASLLGTDEGAVRSRREDALALLATDLGASSGEEVGALVHDMRELPVVRWRDDGEAHHEPPPEPEPERPGPPPAVVQPGAKRKRRLGPAVLVGILVAAVVALVLALSSGGGDDGGDGVASEQPAQPAAGKRAKLAPIAGGKGDGNAEVRGNRLELSVSGLPDPGGAGYVVWLYNSLSETRPLSQPQSKPAFDLKIALPEGAGRYRFIDVSLEPADSNPNHSGQSVLRVPLSKLR